MVPSHALNHSPSLRPTSFLGPLGVCMNRLELFLDLGGKGELEPVAIGE